MTRNQSPEIRNTELTYRKRIFDIEYFYRSGYKHTIVFIHGLGGAKENYWEACKSNALRDFKLICLDNPGTGNSTYYDDFALNVDDLTEITSLFIESLNLGKFILVGTSMGGLTTLLYMRNKGTGEILGYVNIEGNLLPEDCMFSSKVIEHDYKTFYDEVFPRTIREMKAKGNTGYHIIANNLQLNTNVRSYYNYSFQTVEYSSTGELLTQFMDLKIPKLFIYGDENKTLSYIPKLVASGVPVKSIPDSNHFVFYDNPKDLYDEIGSFVHTLV